MGVDSYNKEEDSMLTWIEDNVESEEIKEWKQMMEDRKESDLQRICKSYNIEMEKDKTIQNWHDDFFAKYPMISVVRTYDVSQHKETIANYIGGTAK